MFAVTQKATNVTALKVQYHHQTKMCIYRRAFDVSYFYFGLLTRFGGGILPRHDNTALHRQSVLAFSVLISYSLKDEWMGHAPIEWNSFSDLGPFTCPSNECQSSAFEQSSWPGLLCTAGNEKNTSRALQSIHWCHGLVITAVYTWLPCLLNFVLWMIHCFHKGEAACASATMISPHPLAFVLMSLFDIHYS